MRLVMDRVVHISALLAFAVGSAILPSSAIADGLKTYFESSAQPKKPRSNAGVSVNGDRVSLKADVALRAPNAKTEVIPNLSSAFTLAKNLELSTRVNLAEWNTRTDTTFDTRLHFRRSLGPFLDELEGRVWRTPDGLSRQLLKLGFYQILPSTRVDSPLTITGRATVEAADGSAPRGVLAGARDTQRLGVETVFGGLMSPFLPGANTFSVKVERVMGARSGIASTLAYDQSWSVSQSTKLGLNMKFLRQTYSANDFEPSLGFTWRSEF
jgi:hypothetical protein